MGEYRRMKTTRARDRDQRSGDRDRNATRVHFSRKQLDVYRIALDYVAFVYGIADDLSGKHRHSRDQLLRASQSIPLNMHTKAPITVTITAALITITMKKNKLPTIRNRQRS